MSFTPQPKIKKIIRLPKLQLVQNKQIVKMALVSSGGKAVTLKSAYKSPQVVRSQKQQEEDKLRAQLHQEIELRSRQCANVTYDCTLPRLQDRDYCARHILSDPSAPYKQCTYVHTPTAGTGTGRRCHLPAPAQNEAHSSRRDIGLCFEHAQLAMIARQHSSCSAAPPITPATKLQKLQHYVKPERPRTISSASAVSVVSDAGDQDPGTVVLDPFKQMDAGTVVSAAASTVLDYRSDTDSDSEVLMGPISGPAGADEDSSGPEDVPFTEDPLMSAGVYTSEEVVRCSQAALVALQSVYLGQMNRLRRKLRHKRIRYLAALRREKEVHCSIHNQASTSEVSGAELQQLKQLKAMTSLQKKYGVDAILAKKLHEKRLKAGGVSVSGGGAASAGSSKCIYTEGGVKCGQQSLPLAKHCRKHILLDTNQVLFSMCGDTRAGHLCQEARPPYPISDARHLGDDHTPACVFHTDPPPYTVFTLRKDESDDTEESDTEEGLRGEDLSEMGEVAEEVTIGAEQSSGENTSDVIIDCLVSQESMNEYNG